MHIAKMTTNYPEFHGTGYYNFLMATTRDELEGLIEDNLHDFSLAGIVKTRHQSVDNIVKLYPSRQQLNDKYFKG